MKGFNKNVGLIYLLLVLYIIVKLIFKLDSYAFYNYYIDPIIWILILFTTFFMVKDDNVRIKDRFGKFQTLLILSILYLIVYFATGLFFGFEYSPYSRDIFVMLKNIWAFVVIIIFQEKIRCVLINYTSNRFIIRLIITILFIFINLNTSTFLSSFGTFDSVFKYIFGTFLPLCVQQILFTYLAHTCGFKSLIAYRIPIELSYIILPIFPRLDWFLLGIFNFVYCFMIFLIINYEYNNKDGVKSRRNKASNPITYIPLLIIIILFISFVMGLFKYRPLAIMSNSMVPIFSRGDMVIVKNIDKNTIQKLSINDIIEYRLDEHIVVHRIIEIEENDGLLYFKTKGDNNNAPDVKYVSESQITGIVKMSIPKIGYPTVWLSELFTGKKPDVEMG